MNDILNKILAIRRFNHTPVLSEENKQEIKDQLIEVITEDMERYEVIRIIKNLKPYLGPDGPDEEKMLKQNFLNTAGINPEPEEPSFLDSDVVVRYKFEGPFDSKNRDFCHYMLANYRTSYFRREDISQMSFSAANNEFGLYSIWEYKGSFGCRHSWSAYVFRVKQSGEGTVIRRSAEDSSKVNSKPKV